MKLLIVDDVPFMLISMHQLLERNGYDVVTAEGGMQALSVLESDLAIDAVITDLVMTDMSGVDLYHLAQTIRRRGNHSQTPLPPFILMTAVEVGNSSGRWAMQIRVAEDCFSAIIQKPIVESELIRALKRIDFECTATGKQVQRLRALLQDASNRVSQIRRPEELVDFVAALHAETSRFCESLAPAESLSSSS